MAFVGESSDSCPILLGYTDCCLRFSVSRFSVPLHTGFSRVSLRTILPQSPTTSSTARPALPLYLRFAIRPLESLLTTAAVDMRFPTSFMGGGSDFVYFFGPSTPMGFAVIEIGTRNATIQARTSHFTLPVTWTVIVYALLAPQACLVLIQLITR